MDELRLMLPVEDSYGKCELQIIFDNINQEIISWYEFPTTSVNPFKTCLPQLLKFLSLNVNH